LADAMNVAAQTAEISIRMILILQARSLWRPPRRTLP
jgi:hypothetical protein